MPTATADETFAEWQERNPLRIWRKNSGRTMAEIAVEVGVSITALQKWESGTSTPNSANMKKLGQLTSDSAIEFRWRDWANSYRP